MGLAEQGAMELPVANGNDTSFLDHTLADDRSSSLSDIDEDRLDTDQLDDSPIVGKLASEVDSEAETERIDESPNRPRDRASIVLSTAGTFEASPSKLAQSTTYDELEEDEDEDEEDEEDEKAEEEEEAETDRSPSKLPRSKTNGTATATNDAVSKKRKRPDSPDETGTEPADDEPVRKRRDSHTADDTVSNSYPEPSVTPAIAEEQVKSTDMTPAPEEAEDEDTRPSVAKTKKGKKGKRKGKKVKEIGEDSERQSVSRAEADENGAGGENAEEEENAEVDEADDAEATTKLEEEYARKTSALDVLSSLERQFATLRDKVYDERIASLNNELAQLESDTPTHPEYLRQLAILERYRDDKIRHEALLFKYKLASLITRGQAERSQAISTYFQRSRDVREQILEEISASHYRLQQDRFQNVDATPNYVVPFSLRRSQQVAQQTAYNKEVSVLSGFAKYVGFPAAPTIQPARRNEVEEDLEKMGISSRPHPMTSTTSGGFNQTPFSRNAFSSTPLGSTRPGGEDEFPGEGSRLDRGYGNHVNRALT